MCIFLAGVGEGGGWKGGAKREREGWKRGRDNEACDGHPMMR